MEGSRLKEIAAHDPHFMRTMERAIRVGESVLLKVRELVHTVDHAIC